MSTLNWKTVRNLMGVAIGIRAEGFMVVKEHLFGEDQYFVTHGKKLIGVANDAQAAKDVCVRDPVKDPVPELDFAAFSDMQR